MRARRIRWSDSWAGMVLCIAMTAGSALAQPIYDKAYVDTQKDTQAWIFMDDYLIDSGYGVDYDSVAMLSSPSHGAVSYDSGWGLFTYVPDSGYEGFDGFAYTVKDWSGAESQPIYVFIYVEPDGSITNVQPVIVGFWIENCGGGYYGFNGYVLDDQDPYGRTVQFGGVVSGQTTVGYDGAFCFVTTVPPDSEGVVRVNYEDPWQVYSEWGVGWLNPAY